MSKEIHSESHRKIYILIAVDVPQLRTLRAFGDDGIDQIFPEQIETGRYSGIGEERTVTLDIFLRFLSSFGMTSDQSIQVTLLHFSEVSFRAGIERPVSDVLVV